ncbi:sulfate permease, partial [Aphelenchoides avenae]
RWPMRHSPASLQLTASMPASLRHSSISSSAPQGTFAVVSMMTHAVKTKMLAANLEGANATLAANGEAGVGSVDVLELTSSLTFGVGVFLTLMGIFRLSFLTRYMSDPLVSGFTTGCAVHVFMSQMLYDDVLALPNANLYTIGIAAVGIVFLSLGRDYVNPWFKKRYRIPLPLELFLVIVAIGASQLLNLELNYGVKIVKHVPQGIPSPSLPNFALLRTIWPDALAIAVICYMFVFSMGQLFAKKHKYQIDANQELYALGFGSLLGSFFPIYPAGASLSRSSVCEMAGAKTQLNALFTTTLLFIVIAALGPLLEPLPMTVLACIVMVSLKSLFLQVTELPRLWTISKFDFVNRVLKRYP